MRRDQNRSNTKMVSRAMKTAHALINWSPRYSARYAGEGWEAAEVDIFVRYTLLNQPQRYMQEERIDVQ